MSLSLAWAIYRGTVSSQKEKKMKGGGRKKDGEMRRGKEKDREAGTGSWKQGLNRVKSGGPELSTPTHRERQAQPKLRAREERYRPTREGVQPQAGPHFMPCWKTEFRLVLQMIRSAHWTTTMLTKKAVWHVNSTTFLCSYVCTRERHTGSGVL